MQTITFSPEDIDLLKQLISYSIQSANSEIQSLENNTEGVSNLTQHLEQIKKLTHTHNSLIIIEHTIDSQIKK